MYGPWWESGPSGLKDFSPQYNESYVRRDFVGKYLLCLYCDIQCFVKKQIVLYVYKL